MLIKNILFVLFLSAAGAAISCGFVAFITLLGVFEKLSEQIKVMKSSKIIEYLIIAGVNLGNLFFLLGRPINFANRNVMLILYIIFNLFGGMFVGCLAGALAETLTIFPIISRRFGVRTLLPYILISAALGKVFGSFVELYLLM